MKHPRLMVSMALMLALCGCMESLIDSKGFGTFSPTPALLRNVPQGNDSFSVGWRDGCSTYLGFTGSGLIEAREFAFDINRSLSDKQYAAGFREGASLCMYYTDTRPN